MVLLFSSLWVAPRGGMGLDFIVFAHLLLSHCGLIFLFGRRVYFFGRFQHPSVDGCSIASCDLVLSQEEVCPCPSTLPFKEFIPKLKVEHRNYILGILTLYFLFLQTFYLNFFSTYSLRHKLKHIINFTQCV